MTILSSAIAKLQQLAESALPEVSNFIDFLIQKHQSRIADGVQDDIAKAWAKWFEGVDLLEVRTTEQNSEYQQLLLNKYRQQGLEL